MAPLASSWGATSSSSTIISASPRLAPRFGARVTRAVRCFQGGNDTGAKQAASGLRLNFKIPYRVNFGQSVGLVGAGETFGNWDPKRTVHMKWTDGDWWTVELSVSPGLEVEYKYVVVNSDGTVGHWKPGSNYRVILPTIQPTAAKVPKRIKVSDAWDDSFKRIDVEEEPIAVPASNSSSNKGATAPQAQARPQSAAQPIPQSAAQAAPPTGASSNGAPPQPKTPPSTSASANPLQNGAPRPLDSPRATSPRSGAPMNFAAATTIPVISPLLMTEQERLEDGVRNSLEDLQNQMDKHQQLRDRTDDPAAPEILVADRIVAAANNRVVAYNKALKAVQEYNRLPPSPSPKDSSNSNGSS